MKTIGPGRVTEPRVHWPRGIFGNGGAGEWGLERGFSSIY